jgi:hypothetical protein
LTFSLTVIKEIYSSDVSRDVAWHRATNISEDFYLLLCKDKERYKDRISFPNNGNSLFSFVRTKKDMRKEPPSQTMVTLPSPL